MAYNSAYTGSQVDAAVGAVRQKETKWDNKQDELTGTEDQLVGFNSAGEAVAVAKPDPLPTGGETGQVLTKTSTGAQWDDIPSDLPAGGTDGQILTKTADGVAWEDAPDTGVTSFNSRTGAVTPQEGDYTADMVGARPDTWTPSAADVGAVPTSRTVNGKALSQDISLSASDVGARPDTWTPSAADVGALPTQTGTQGQLLGFTANNVVGAVAAPTADSLGAVPNTRTINGQALNQNITLDAEDVGAIPPPTRLTATLNSSSWSGNSQTITVNGVITDTSAQDIDISCADKASADAWAAGGVWCSNPTQANKLTFTCTTPPTANINLNIRLWEVASGKPFADYGWDEIIAACQSGQVPDTWVADGTCSKAMTIGGTSYTIDVIGKQHDQYADGGTAPLTFQLRQIPVSLHMNQSATISGGWGASTMRSTELPKLKTQLPVDIQNAIRMVRKQSNGVWTQDDLFLLSSPEVFGGGGDSGEQYAYYQAGNSKIKGYWYDPSITAPWWLRDYNGAQFRAVDDNGALIARTPTFSIGVTYAFCF